MLRIATLLQLCGSEMSQKHFKAERKKSLDLLGKIGFLETWEFREDLVMVRRKH